MVNVKPDLSTQTMADLLPPATAVLFPSVTVTDVTATKVFFPVGQRSQDTVTDKTHVNSDIATNPFHNEYLSTFVYIIMWDIEEELTRFVLSCQAIPNWKVVHCEEVLFVHQGQELPLEKDQNLSVSYCFTSIFQKIKSENVIKCLFFISNHAKNVFQLVQ